MARPSGRKTSQFQINNVQPQTTVPSIENNFVAGLKTEFTGLNFPENACTATSNCRFTRVGDVKRRGGIDYESGFTTFSTNRNGSAISNFQWTNAGGLGNSVIEVRQIGGTLYFYLISNATNTTSLSSTLLVTTVALSTFAQGATSPNAIECQYSAGNGYLFVYHPTCNPFYCTFDGTNIVANAITVQIRDFIGINEPNVPVNLRPTGLSAEHKYNLQNQGWGSSQNTLIPGTIVTTSTSTIFVGGSIFTATWAVAPGLSIQIGNPVSLQGTFSGTTISVGSGTVTGYSGGSLTCQIIQNGNQLRFPGNFTANPWTFTITGSVPATSSLINLWQVAVGNYPSNADIWWAFKDDTNTFNPAATVNNVTLNAGPAPKGYYILNAFDQERSVASGVGGITPVLTSVRPRTGAFFQGRVWYAGVDASQAATGDASFYTWTENIYFSQVLTNINQVGFCYQTNDPTSETLNAELPTDGGVIVIPGSGSIYKLYPITNGLLVFAANGIWFITGSSGLGFTATDYVVTKVSGEHALSGTSFVDVAGYPIFWNADGIYSVMPGQSLTSGQRALDVKNLTLETIKSFYNNIPISSKLFAKGSYNHITGEVQWVFRSTPETDITSRYSFDSVLVFLTYTNAFFPWTIGAGSNIHDVSYVELTGSTPANTPPPGFRYFASTPSGGTYNFTFAQEIDFNDFDDWDSTGTDSDYTSFFTTSYRLKGQAQRKFQPQYVYLFHEDTTNAGYKIQGIWDYAVSNLSNKYSSVEVANLNQPLFAKNHRKHRIRGNGYTLQFNVTSVPGLNFDISGWSVLDIIGTA